ncbi:MAG: hypothetical protein ACI86M_001514 [Saprospiraceae bacterium]|jgi:hypothetical protein
MRLFNLSCIFIIISISSYAQDKDEVIRYLENKQYADKSYVEYIIDTKDVQFGEGVYRDLHSNFKSEIERSYRFLGVNKHSENKGDSKLKVTKDIIKKPSHYLFILKIANFKVEDTSSNLSNYILDANIKCIDLISGLNIGQVSFRKAGSIIISNISSEEQTSFSLGLGAKIRQIMVPFIRKTFPITNHITRFKRLKKKNELHVNVDRKKYFHQGSPKYLFAHMVDQEYNVDGKKVFTFIKLGILHSVVKPKKGEKEISYLFKGERKKIVSIYNEGIKIYITNVILGPDI